MIAAVRGQRPRLQLAKNRDERVRQGLPRIRDPPGELREAWNAIRVRKKECRQLREIGSLFGDVEQNVRRGREWFARRIGNDAQREQWNPTRSAHARDEFRLHVRRGRARFAGNFVSLIAGIDQRWRS